MKKYKALLKDAQDELEHERETKNNPAALRSLRTQLEDYEMRELAATKAQKRIQSDLDEMQAQCDDLTRVKIEVKSGNKYIVHVHVNMYVMCSCSWNRMYQNYREISQT